MTGFLIKISTATIIKTTVTIIKTTIYFQVCEILLSLSQGTRFSNSRVTSLEDTNRTLEFDRRVIIELHPPPHLWKTQKFHRFLQQRSLKTEVGGKHRNGKSVAISVVYLVRWKIFQVYTDGKKISATWGSSWNKEIFSNNSANFFFQQDLFLTFPGT